MSTLTRFAMVGPKHISHSRLITVGAIVRVSSLERSMAPLVSLAIASVQPKRSEY